MDGPSGAWLALVRASLQTGGSAGQHVTLNLEAPIVGRPSLVPVMLRRAGNSCGGFCETNGLESVVA